MEKSELLNSVQAHEILFFLSPKTIRNYASEGKIPSVKLGKRTYFRAEELKKYVKNNTSERGVNNEYSRNSK